jgi:hypothetical protein
MQDETSVVRIPMTFVRNTVEHRRDNGLTVAKLAAIVLKEFTPPKTTVYLADEFKARHNLDDSDYACFARMGKLVETVTINGEKYKYLKSVWVLCH